VVNELAYSPKYYFPTTHMILLLING